MSKYSHLINEHIKDVNDVAVNSGEGNSFTSGSLAASVSQSVFLNVTQSGTETITHNSDVDGKRLVYINKLYADTGISNTQLDFDQVDEANFIQEDSVSGTDFIDGLITLHNSGTGTSVGTVNVALNSADLLYSGANSGRFGLLFDGVSGDLTTGTWQTPETVNNWVEFTLPNPKIIGKYSITNATLGSRGITECYLQYWDGDSWEDIDHEIGILYTTADETKEFLVDNPTITPYDKYRLFLPELDFTNISEIKLYELIGDMEYPTSLPGSGYYVTTTDLSAFPLINVIKINSVDIIDSQPTGTSVSCLVSFDGRTSWKKWDESSWNDHVGGLTDKSGWSTITDIETGFTNFNISSEQAIDIAFLLSSNDSSKTPSLDLVTINYNEEGVYKSVKLSDYKVEHLADIQTKITKLSSGTDESIKVNILL